MTQKDRLLEKYYREFELPDDVNPNCLMASHPHLAKSWHPTRNGSLTAYDLTIDSETEIWWLCRTHGEIKNQGSIGTWKAKPRDCLNTNGDLIGCPLCTKEAKKFIKPYYKTIGILGFLIVLTYFII